MYVANFNSDNVSVIDTSTRTVIANIITTGDSPRTLAFDMTNNQMYITNFASSDISVIDTSNVSVFAFETMPTGSGTITVDIPEGIAHNHKGNASVAAEQFIITYE